MAKESWRYKLQKTHPRFLRSKTPVLSCIRAGLKFIFLSLLLLQVVTVYNELPDEHEKSSCNGFDLNVNIKESNGISLFYYPSTQFLHPAHYCILWSMLIMLDRFSHVDSKQCEPIVNKLPSIIQWRRAIQKISEGRIRIVEGSLHLRVGTKLCRKVEP